MAARSPVNWAESELLEATACADLHGRFGLKAGSDVAVVRRWADLSVPHHRSERP